MRTIKRDIVGAIIFSNDGHVLLGKNVKGGVYDDLWVIPAGGIDDNETKEQAVCREILEETGINLRKASLKLLPDINTGITEKTLRDTGERVIVDMTFYDFRADIDQPANEIDINLTDDFGHAEWVPFDNLAGKSYSPSVKKLLESLDLL